MHRELLVALLVTGAALVPGGARAGEIDLWTKGQFGVDGALAGQDDWTAGYPGDPWYTDGDGAYSDSDVNNGDTSGAAYGSGWAADNWIIRGDLVAQGGIEGEYVNDDDDTIGVVFAHDGEATFYLAAHSAGSVPPPMPSISTGTLYLIRVEAGEASVLGARELALSVGQPHLIRLERDDERLSVSIDGALELSADDPSPLPAGRAGFYAYDSGDDGGWGSTEAWFDGVLVFAGDEDDDGVADDLDNCEETPNPEQADEDADGFGDACDEAIDEGPDGEPGEQPGPGDAAEPDGSFVDEELYISSACGCSTGQATAWHLSGPLGLLPMMLAALITATRRRPGALPSSTGTRRSRGA